MRSVSRGLFRILNNEKFLPVTLIDIQLPGSTASSVMRMTDAGEEVSFDGYAYTPINLTRGLHSELLSAEGNQQPFLTMTVQNVDRQMATLLNNAEIEGSKATVYVTDRRLVHDSITTQARDVLVAARGEVRDPQLSESTFIFNVTNIMGIMDSITVPRRVYQPKCNYAYGSRACGVDVTAYPNSIPFSTLAGTNHYEVVGPSSIISAAGTEDPTDFFKNGYAIVTDGPAILQARPIHRIVEDESGNARIFVTHPFLTSPHTGTVTLRRGCPKTPEGCAARQADGTAKNFGGFWNVPHGRIKPRTIYKNDLDPAWGDGYL